MTALLDSRSPTRGRLSGKPSMPSREVVWKRHCDGWRPTLLCRPSGRARIAIRPWFLRLQEGVALKQCCTDGATDTRMRNTKCFPRLCLCRRCYRKIENRDVFMGLWVSTVKEGLWIDKVRVKHTPSRLNLLEVRPHSGNENGVAPSHWFAKSPVHRHFSSVLRNGSCSDIGPFCQH